MSYNKESFLNITVHLKKKRGNAPFNSFPENKGGKKLYLNY